MRVSRIPAITLVCAATAGALAAGAGTLLTQTDVSKAAGTTFNNGKLERSEQTPYGKYTVCTWSGKAHPLNVVRVSVWADASAFKISRFLDF